MSNESKNTARKAITLMSICLDEDNRSRVWNVLNTTKGGYDFVGDFHYYLGDKDDVSLVQTLKDNPPNICLLDFDENREKAIRTAEQLQQVMQGRMTVFAVSSQSDPELIISAMRCGCTEYLLKPLQPDRLTDALLKVASKKREYQSSKQGKIVSLLGVKGGSGVTAITIHLASFLARSGRKTLVIDHHPDLGDAALYLGFSKHRYHFYELISNVHRLDAELLEGFVVHHDSGLDLLAAPEDFGASAKVNEYSLRDTLEFLREAYDVVLVDCAPGLTEYNIAAVEKSDQLVVVATPELPSIRNMARYLDHLLRYNYPPEKIVVAINRYSKKSNITDQQIERAIRRRIDVMIPNSYAEIIQAINTGSPVAPGTKSDLAKVFSRWAENLVPRSMAAAVGLDNEKPTAKRGLGILGL